MPAALRKAGSPGRSGSQASMPTLSPAASMSGVDASAAWASWVSRGRGIWKRPESSCSRASSMCLAIHSTRRSVAATGTWPGLPCTTAAASAAMPERPSVSPAAWVSSPAASMFLLRLA